MKKIYVICAAAVLAIATTAIVMVKTNVSSVLESDVEALADCEITNSSGKIVFQCQGNTDECDASKYGYTLTCSGEEVR